MHACRLLHTRLCFCLGGDEVHCTVASTGGQWPPRWVVWTTFHSLHGWDWPTLKTGYPALGVLFTGPQGRAQVPWIGPAGGTWFSWSWPGPEARRLESSDVSAGGGSKAHRTSLCPEPPATQTATTASLAVHMCLLL